MTLNPTMDVHADQVFAFVLSATEPVTLRALERQTGIPSADLDRLLDELCDVGLVRRLNTVIQSYRPPAATAS
jgi:DNA-binding IclR family transcriptional regulator